MSVLLDALKKAAEEKKNAEKSAVEGGSVTEKQSPSLTPVELALEVTSDGDLQNESSSDNQHGELPIFNLKIEADDLDTFENIEDEAAIQLKDEQDESLHVPEIQLAMEDNNKNVENGNESVHEETKDFDLVSLIDSLDVDEVAEPKSQGLSISNVNKSNQNAMTLESHLESSSDIVDLTGDDKADSLDNDSIQSDDFSWGMDNLPAYTDSQSNEVKNQASSQPVNPVLLNTGETSTNANKKYTTSSRIIVSLVVILLFIGIGFYGMLYYQEQNENLERSMRKYNLSKMPLPQNPNSPVPSKPIENFEEVTPLNVVSNKVIELGKSLKESVESNVIEPLTTDSHQVTSSVEEIEKNDLQLVENKKPPTESLDNNKRVSTKSLNDNPVLVAKKSVNVVPVSPSNKVAKYQSPATQNRIVLTGSRTSDIGKAYSAYSSGDYDNAERLFTKTLSKEPENINALLGLGGIGVAQGNYLVAINYYQKVLDIKPNNLYAFEAISNLSGHLELNKSWESELRDMALKYPNSAVLQYAQGNLYARQNDWLSAQQSYFQAYALEPGNPDYMMNLAVSFDHLGKYAMASQYYTQALAFADNTKVSFDKKRVKDRLISIRQFIVKGQ